MVEGPGALRYLCIHGHFYQPPREDPWLEAVEVEDSAAPFHDWNERITAECYGPNTAARILDHEQMVVGIMNNFSRISFDVGPTLLAWLQRNAPEVARGILEGDRISRDLQGGHGNALAQSYNHTILPLDRPRDRLTQVRWGLHVFRSFFRREPEGMWLPEAAVDIPTLEVLAQEGIRFTILAPHQAARIRPLGASAWEEVRGEVDPTGPYLCRLPSGREIALFFYHGGTSRAVAFEGLLNDGEAFYQRLLSGFRPERAWPQLVHIATDGESYGHHHRFGEMALAYALQRALQDPSVCLTNYAHYLALNPPRWEVEIAERTSWSCAHGIERWRADCGCHLGWEQGWHQRWRGPLRQALDYLKGELDGVFEREGGRVLRDPWAARDAYVEILLDRSPRVVEAFWEAHRSGSARDQDLPVALRLLEMQRHGMLMFTSCGWFFDEISGLESVQVLKYAARALQLAQSFGEGLEERLVQILERAQSNLPRWRNARRIWEVMVRPSVVDLNRVVAHCAMRSLFREWKGAEDLYAFRIQELHEKVESLGTTRVAVGRVRVRSIVTQEEAEALFGVVHFGGLDFSCFQMPPSSQEEAMAVQGRILKAYRTMSVGDAYSLMLEVFPPPIYHLRDLFVEEQRHVVNAVLKDRFREYLHAMEVLAEEDLGIVSRLASLRFPIPEPMAMACTIHVNRLMEHFLEELPADGDALDRAQELLERSLEWGYKPDRQNWGRSLLRRLEETLEALISGAMGPMEAVPVCERILEAAQRLEIPLNLWRAQNLLIRASEGSRNGWEGHLGGVEALGRRLRLKETLFPWRRPGGGGRQGSMHSDGP